MAWRMVKQPNGLYARWSDIVDAFTHMNLTQDQALGVVSVEFGRAGEHPSVEDLKQKVRAADEERGWRGERETPGYRWRECVETLRRLKKDDLLQKYLSLDATTVRVTL